jgi:hypothetical protein
MIVAKNQRLILKVFSAVNTHHRAGYFLLVRSYHASRFICMDILSLLLILRGCGLRPAISLTNVAKLKVVVDSTGRTVPSGVLLKHHHDCVVEIEWTESKMKSSLL